MIEYAIYYYYFFFLKKGGLLKEKAVYINFQIKKIQWYWTKNILGESYFFIPNWNQIAKFFGFSVSSNNSRDRGIFIKEKR